MIPFNPFAEFALTNIVLAFRSVPTVMLESAHLDYV